MTATAAVVFIVTLTTGLAPALIMIMTMTMRMTVATTMAISVAVMLSLTVCAAAPVISVASMLMCRTMLARDYQVGIHETRINQVRSGLFLVDDLRYDCGYDWGCLAFYDDLRRMVLMTVMTAVPIKRKGRMIGYH